MFDEDMEFNSFIKKMQELFEIKGFSTVNIKRNLFMIFL